MFSILHSFFIFFSFKIVLAGSNHKPVCSDIFSNQQITFSHMVTAANKSENSIQMELNTSVIIEGRLKKYSLDENNQLAYLSFVGPTRIIETDLSEIPGQGFNYHKDGFSTAIGDFSFVLNGHEKKSTAADFVESLPMLIDTGQVKLQFRSGVVVVGELKSIVYSINDQKPIILRFLNCTVTYKDKTLYRPTWGTYDMVLGSFINDIADSPGQF